MGQHVALCKVSHSPLSHSLAHGDRIHPCVVNLYFELWLLALCQVNYLKWQMYAKM